MITLIIVDCQNDFISGSMSVKGAPEAIKNIKTFISNHKKDIEKIIFTCDWHPYNHGSFKRNGGKWPTHCVQFTPGACIESKLLKFVQSMEIPYEVDTKGEIVELEQYGAFVDIEIVQDSSLYDRVYFDSIVSADANSEFVICGVEGDSCVKESLKNILYVGQLDIKVFLPGIACMDGGTQLRNFITTRHIPTINE